MSLTATVARNVEDALFRQTSFVGPAKFWVALFDVTDTELSYSGYGRQEVDNNSASWGANDTIPANVVPITFVGPTTAGPHTPATAWKLMSASSGGFAYVQANLVTPRTPQEDVDMVFNAGDLSHAQLPTS